MFEGDYLMNYVLDMVIETSREACLKGYLEANHMYQWQSNLKSVEHEVGHLFDAHAMGYLNFEMGNYTMRMKVTVASNDLPEAISIIYEVTGAWNKCIHKFTETSEGYTHWQMDVEFQFEQDPSLDISIFMSKTKESMILFKNYMERSYR